MRQTHPQTQNRINPATMRLHRDPNRAMQQTMDAIKNLMALYEKETQALEEMDTNKFMALQTDKEKFALSYEASIKEIVARKQEMDQVEPHLKDQLNTMQGEFSELSHKNMSALSRMGRAVDRLNATVREFAREEAQKMQSFSYGHNARIQTDKSKSISVSINEDA